MKMLYRYMWAQFRYSLLHLRNAFFWFLGSLYTMFYWPTPSLFGGGEVMEILLISMWFTAAVFLSAPLAMGSTSKKVMHGCPPLPILPVRMWVRVLGDALLALCCLLFVRCLFVGVLTGVGMFWEGSASKALLRVSLRGSSLSGTLWGVLFMVPFLALVLSSRTSRSPSARNLAEQTWVQMLVWVGLMFLAVRSGWMVKPLFFVLVCVVFTILPFPLLWLVRRVWPGESGKRHRWSGSLMRPAGRLQGRMMKDMIGESMPWLIGLGIAGLGLVVLQGYGVFSKELIKGGFFLLLGFASFACVVVLFRPILRRMCFLQTGENSWSGSQMSVGACSVLPLKRSVMLRWFFLYGCLSGLLVWGGYVGLDVLGDVLQGRGGLPWSLADWLSLVILPLGLWIPLMASAFVFFSVRAKLWIFLSSMAFVFSIQLSVFPQLSNSPTLLGSIGLVFWLLFGIRVCFLLFPGLKRPVG